MSRFLNINWVKDNLNNIEWSSTVDVMLSWDDAVVYVKDRNCRLPSVKELQSIVDYDRSNPAVDIDFFGDTKLNEWYWTNKQRVGKPEEAFCVSFVGGCCNAQDRNGLKYFRMVRDI